MAAWPLPEQHAGKALTRRFGVLSAIVTGLITIALSLVISFFLRKDLLDREWRFTADYVTTEAFSSLHPSDFTAPQTSEAVRRFEAFYRQAVMMPGIVRVKIYDASMAVIWSDEPRLLGQRFPDNPHLRGALAGITMVNIGSDDTKEEHVYERQHLSSQLVEVYVPIVFPGTTEVVGAVETYRAPGEVLANVRQGQITVFGTTLAGGVLLYLCLFWIVRRAARRIDEQHQALETRSRDLATANEELQTVQGQLLEAERMAASRDPGARRAAPPLPTGR